MSNKQALPVLVAGGGIGGLAAALALVRQGFSVKVFEQSPEIGEIGAGIQLGPNASMLLMRLVWAPKPAPKRCTPITW